MATVGLSRPRRKAPVRQGPPLVVFVGLTAEHANTTGLARRLHRIAAPTLLVAGDRDRFYTPELFRETAERIPGARLRLYPGKGHAGVMTHRPAIREIVAFLTADRAET